MASCHWSLVLWESASWHGGQGECSLERRTWVWGVLGLPRPGLPLIFCFVTKQVRFLPLKKKAYTSTSKRNVLRRNNGPFTFLLGTKIAYWVRVLNSGSWYSTRQIGQLQLGLLLLLLLLLRFLLLLLLLTIRNDHCIIITTDPQKSQPSWKVYKLKGKLYIYY